MHTSSTNVNRKAAQSEATRGRLLASARELFGARGFASVGTEEIVRHAGVTRGALYHQFADKRDLFRAVFEEVDAEVVGRVAERGMSAGDPFAVLTVGASTWLDAALDPEVQRIVLLDAPAVLGHEEWRALGEKHGLGIILSALQEAVDAGAIAPAPVRALGHVIVGALDEAALYVARADDPREAREEAETVLTRLLESLRL